ncbi:MAG: DEAD/DEAH box helicase [Desulfobacterales bacterium]|nr:DEAD/DEAH box helicase [Desulfobacterales bacterium]
MGDKIREKLVAVYKTLSPLEQALIQLCSVIYEPTNESTILMCFQKSDIVISEKNTLDTKTVTSYLGKLQELNFLNGKFQCNETFVEVASRAALDAGYYEEMVRAVHTDMPLRQYAYIEPSRFALRLMRDFRIAIYTGNQEDFTKYYYEMVSCYHNESDYCDPFVRVCNNPFEGAWFKTLPSDLRIYVLSLIFHHTVLKLVPASEALAYVLNKDFWDAITKEEKFKIYNFLIPRLIFGGQLSVARQMILEIEEFVDVRGMKGWLCFLEGDNDKAIEVFEEGLKDLRKKTGKRRAYFMGIEGVIFILALIKHQIRFHDTALLNKIDQLIKAGEFNCYKSRSLFPVYVTLKAIVLSQQGEAEKAREILSSTANHLDSIGIFFSTFAAYWIDNRLSQKKIDQLSQLFIKAKEVDLKWLALECAELLCRAEQGTPVRLDYVNKTRRETDIQSMTSLIQIEAPWQKSLRALFHTINTNRQPGTGSGEKRLIWLINYSDGRITLQAKEQKLTAKGNWSKGRPVAMSRLHSGRNLDYITAQDHMIRGTINQEYGYYNGIEYGFFWEKTLPALVGHPLIFLEESPSVSVEVVKASPEIVAEEISDGITLRFIPEIPKNRVTIIREMPTRFKVVELSEEQQRIAGILGEKGLTVPLPAKKEVLSLIAGISSVLTVHSDIGGKSKDIEEIEAESNIYLHLLPAGSGFRLEMFVKPFGNGGPYLKPGKGTENVIVAINGKRMQTHRDLEVEEKKACIIEQACPTLSLFSETDRQWLLNQPEDCLQVLLDLKTLQDQSAVKVEWPEGGKLNLTHRVSFEHLNLKIQCKTDWFEVSGELKVDENLVLDMRRLLDLVQKTQSRFIPLEDGQFIALTETFRKKLEEINAYSKKHGKGIRMHPLAALTLDDFADQLSNLDVDKTWRDRVKRFKDSQILIPPVPSTLKAELRDYQIDGYRWLARLADWGVGGCLADDMGLGKTLQALSIILDRASKGPSLVVAPMSVCMNWLSEAQRFSPTLNFTLLGNKDRSSLVKNLKAFDVLVTSYGLLQQETDLLTSIHWHTIVLDEAQAIKNVTTKRSRAAMSLKGEFKLITTGTPIENHLEEFFTLFDFVNPGLLGSRKSFNERFVIPIEKNKDKDTKLRLKKLIQPFILRRVKAQVLEELPPRTDVILQVQMSSEETAFYDALRRKALDRLDRSENSVGPKHLQILTEITKLRQACCNSRLILPDSNLPSAKLELFGNIVEDLLENHHKALVFSQFVGHLAIIREFLDQKHIDYRYLDGSTTARERKNQVDAFQAGQGDLFLISLRAGGLGLNLTAAGYVIHMDPWWNPAVEDQASDRAHRIGQQQPVTVYRLVTQNTIEEKIVKLHQKKRDLANSLLDGSDISGKISANELLRLIREQ